MALSPAETPEVAEVMDDDEDCLRRVLEDAESDLLPVREEFVEDLEPPPVPLRCSALQRILMEFSVRPGKRAAI